MRSPRKRARLLSRDGFSLVEVMIATGLCTYALLVIDGLLPVGLSMMQNATQQVIETEIFNRMWSQYNTTPFYSLQNSNNGVSAVFPSPNSSIYSYFDGDGQDITPAGTNPTAPAGAVYIVRATLQNTQTSTGLETTVPAVDGGANSSGASLTFVQIQIGYHFDPANLTPGKNDIRVATRAFLLAKRDTWNGS